MIEKNDFGRLDRYLKNQIDSVSGYLSTVDALAIGELGKFQSSRGICGDMCEFGVHHGRLFFILAHLRREGERLLGCDLFIDGPQNDVREHRGRDQAIWKNKERLKIELAEDELLKCDTLKISPDELLARIGKPRLISVDAGHLHHEVQNDMRLAGAIVAEQGVIIADDYFNIYWPDVTTAVNDFLKERDDFAPFLITPGKLYICQKKQLSLYKEFAVALTARSSIKSRVVALNREEISAIRLSRKGELRQKFGLAI